MTQHHRFTHLHGTEQAEIHTQMQLTSRPLELASSPLTIVSRLDCILLKSSLGLSMVSVDAICAKYLGTLFRQPEGATLIGRSAGDQRPEPTERVGRTGER